MDSDTMKNKGFEIIRITCIMGIILSVHTYVGSPTKSGIQQTRDIGSPTKSGYNYSRNESLESLKIMTLSLCTYKI